MQHHHAPPTKLLVTVFAVLMTVLTGARTIEDLQHSGADVLAASLHSVSKTPSELASHRYS